ncbi:MAG: LysR family transcriptional regulator, partial [Planctomycetota bacterium]
MDVHDLRVFAAVARHQHYTRAARELGLSQPAVSARIAVLERELGVRLLQRAGRKMNLTPAGEVLALEAVQVLDRMDAARQAVEEVKGLLRGHVRVGASTTPGIYLVPRAAARFTREHP